MAKIFYKGSDGKDYGPVSEIDAQGWYVCGYFSSDVQFHITQSDELSPGAPFLTLGQLIEMNGRALPFHFSRTREREQIVDQLMKEVASLRMMCIVNASNGQSGQNESIVLLQNQVAFLVEQQSLLCNQLSEVSGQKNINPVAPHFEMKVNDLQKKVNEQEKNFVSMKKELSAVNSKCDRNESRLDKLMEKQNGGEGTENGYDKRLAELKTADKRIRDNLNTCEQKVSSTAKSLKTIQSELSEVKQEMKEEKALSSADRAELAEVREEIFLTVDSVIEHAHHIEEVIEKMEEKLNTELETTREVVEKTRLELMSLQSRTALTTAMPNGPFDDDAESENIAPWEKEEKKAKVCLELKNSKVDDQAKMKAESAPWDDETKVVAEVKKTQVDSGLNKKESAPWDDDKSDEPAPWNEMNGGSKKGTNSKKKRKMN